MSVKPDPQTEEFPTPYLGRSVRIVGPVANIEPKNLPHPMNQRGALGKALFNWMHSTISPDPLARVAFERHAADKANVIRTVLMRAPRGKPAEERVKVDDPAVMTKHLKRVAKHLGADVIRIAASHPSFMYGSNPNDGLTTMGGDRPAGTPEELVRRFPYVIVATKAWDYDLIKAHRHHIGDAAYDFTLERSNLLHSALAGYIQELGYSTLRGAMNPQAAALAAGVGELGRNGMIISEKFGPRIHLTDVVMTDLPLVPDKPVDLGVEDFCKICRKCAITCPTNSITFEGKQIYNGVEKYKIKWETCYRLRPFTVQYWGQCLTCVTVCPYTKPNTWWRDLAIGTLRHTPIPLRPLVVRGLKALDDKFWGTIPNKRVRWLDYDTGIKPGEKACTVAGCTAQHGESHAQPAADSQVGYYFPLKENTNRFVKRG
ncbi:MAG TPA: reductive dehalogenase domain-containing protein [Chloroflexota bacterium]|nr:reductive dehalogenase domain-containing protein [Chloroflexota bacterium]